jgi:uncharacterized protein
MIKSWLFLAVVAVSSAASVPASADDHHPERLPVIVVTGQAIVRTTPDQAFVGLAVESRDPNPGAAQRRNAEVMDAVLAKLAAAQVPKDALRTLSYELMEDFDYDNGKRLSRGFLARNSIEVRVDDLKRVGEIIDVATAAGANSVTGVRFDVKDRSSLEREALSRASGDARARAEAVAKGGGVRVGALVRIEERGSFVPPPPAPYMARMAADEAAAKTSIQPGELEVRAEVSLTAKLEP